MCPSKMVDAVGSVDAASPLDDEYRSVATVLSWWSNLFITCGGCGFTCTIGRWSRSRMYVVSRLSVVESWTNSVRLVGSTGPLSLPESYSFSDTFTMSDVPGL